jgi:stage IV sporulation protein B
MGDAVGLDIRSEGVMVTRTHAEADGLAEADSSGVGKCVLPGDIIVTLGRSAVRSGDDLRRALESLTGEPVAVTVMRDGRRLRLTVTPEPAPEGGYRLGLTVRDGLTGIGTLTFYDPVSGFFGALGHSAGDSDTGTVIPLRDGVIADTVITGVVRGQAASPGQLLGAYDESRSIGVLTSTTDCGIFGWANSALEVSDRRTLPISAASEIKTGAATILCTVSGSETREYDVDITRVFPDAGSSWRGMTISVTDDELVDRTGGIVQGMSGSPIIQNGKLIGAVTHVLVGDPTRGYAVSAESMLLAAEQASAPRLAA